ncbi:MAG: DUF4159 domain-containing protein [Flavobacteriales bacterium]|nr:DUF4159 domain-containing protein [Flavobacteriales bacterium]MBP9079688.1 DUF4159 domain-containing protein [Flavobacteriales bacterium]
MRAVLTTVLANLLVLSASAQGTYPLAVLKYNGGGDWYANPTAVPNLVKFCNAQLGMNISVDVPQVEVGSPDIFNYPWLDATGHGNITFSPQEAQNLRNYLIGGGFLHVSDNYGMDKFLRPALKMVFPELEFVELPFAHPVYHQRYDFPKGLPKIHEHDGLPAQGLGLLWEGRLVCFYDFQCDLGDGWEDPDVHNDPPELHQKALQMGANLVQFVFGGSE